MRWHSVVNTPDGLQVTYEEEGDFDEDTGISNVRVITIPHEVSGNELLSDLQDSVEQVVDAARVAKRKPLEQFKAPR